jgi:hypothetical protein
VSGCICGHEAILCRCSHPSGRHVIADGGTFTCPVHGCMERCQACDCGLFRRADGEDPRDFGLLAEDLRAVADRLYDAGDPRLDPMDHVSARFGTIRSRLRGLADAIEETGV